MTTFLVVLACVDFIDDHDGLVWFSLYYRSVFLSSIPVSNNTARFCSEFIARMRSNGDVQVDGPDANQWSI